MSVLPLAAESVEADLQEVVALVAAAVRLHGPVRTASGDPAPTADVDR